MPFTPFFRRSARCRAAAAALVMALLAALPLLAGARQSPPPVRHYDFEDARDAATPIADRAGSVHSLVYHLTPLSGAPPEEYTVVPGRASRGRAVRLDRGVFTADPIAVTNRRLSIALWFRKNGPGAMRGNNGSTDGTLVSQGTGYYDGFRITTSYPAGTFGFEIGRPAPVGSAGMFGVGPLPDGVWHHIAATWDGSVLRLYLNGSLAREMPYAGAYHIPEPGQRLRIGYAGYGWGSVKLDVDEVSLYDRALSDSEVLALALELPPGSAAISRLSAAHRALHAGRRAEARSLLNRLVSDPSLRGDALAYARLLLARTVLPIGETRLAAGLLSAIAVDPQVSLHRRLAAIPDLVALARTPMSPLRLEVLRKLEALPDLQPDQRRAFQVAIAASLIRSGQEGAGRALFETLIAASRRNPGDRASAVLQLAHELRTLGKHRQARAFYSQVAEDTALSSHVRNQAVLLLARTEIALNDLPAARARLRRLVESPDLALSHAYEARLLLALTDRTPGGKQSAALRDERLVPPDLPAPGLTLHVAPNGSDTNPGTSSRPLASLAGARDRIRALRSRGPLPQGGIAVVFAPGTYRAEATTAFTRQDSGTARSPVVYRAAPGTRVVFSAGARLTQFRRVTDPDVLQRLPESARGKVLECDLRANGVSSPGELRARGVGPEPLPSPALYINGSRAPLARWPNTGWATTGALVAERAPAGGFQFKFSDVERLRAWKASRGGWLYGYWKYLWADAGIPLASADPETSTLTAGPGSAYGFEPNMPFYVYNLLEELDRPGEWVLDADRGMLYVYPPGGSRPPVFHYSVTEEPLITLENVSHVRFEHLQFELGRGDGIRVAGGTSVLIAGCTLRNMGGTAIVVNGGTRHGVFGCDLIGLGRGGVSIQGGDRRTLTPSGHYVENCIVRDFSQWSRTYTPAVWTDGVGTRISRNRMTHSPGHAMRIEGNDHLIQLNEVSNVVTETDDQGGLDMWFNPTYRGVRILHNLWSHIGGEKNDRMRAGVRLDDAICGVLIYGNIFYRAAEGLFGGVQIHGGKENEVVNNLFVDCRTGVSFSGWGPQRWKEYLASQPFIEATTKAVDIARPPYSTRYPALARLAEQPDVNRIWNNIFAGVPVMLARDGGIQDLMENHAFALPPGLVGQTGGLREEALAGLWRGTGLAPIPLSQIGPYPHPLRASAPAPSLEVAQKAPMTK